ncbi:MAG: sxtJ [Halioglobus sp.]|nr:sxtJ [Halioglobus sp.]
MSTKDLRKFGLITGAMLILFFYLLIPWIWSFEKRPDWPLVAAGVLASMSVVFPASLRPVYKVWMRFAEALGWLNTRIILSVIFYLMFVPVGFVMRLFNDPMRRKFDTNADSYRVPSNAVKHENMERPF